MALLIPMTAIRATSKQMFQGPGEKIAGQKACVSPEPLPISAQKEPYFKTKESDVNEMP